MRNLFVSEFIRHEGRGEEANSACECGADAASTALRCTSCELSPMSCQKCMVEGHKELPMHTIQHWTGLFFEKTSLRDLGLRYQVGHSPGHSCPFPEQASSKDEFIIIDIDGIHTVAVDFCRCAGRQDHVTQLLRARLFPATTSSPKTAATFRVLKTFQLLSFMSKVSAFEFYHSLARLTDNTGTIDPPDRYKAFLRMVREFRHVKLMQRFGRGHDAGGVATTKPGECAVQCPACPHPGINLPEDYATRPNSWIYQLFLAIDANFRLKGLQVSTDIRDPGLNRGYAYFVEESAFKAHLAEFGGVIVEEPSTCNNHNAIKMASMRGGKGTRASGVGTVECSRHDMKRPLSVGDLQKGERYVNMDYFFLSSMRQNIPRAIVLSYDIACQWGKNLAQRCLTYPTSLTYGFATASSIRYLVPKFHLPAHIPICQTRFSFNFTPAVGRTDGEAPERGWAAVNAVATSTKEMGPGSRRDTLDDHFGDYNWRKVTVLGLSLWRKLEDTVDGRNRQHFHFLSFSESIDPDLVVKWDKDVRAWEKNNQLVNPFEPTLEPITLAKVRLEMAAREALETREIEHTVSPGGMIMQGIEIEDSQARLRRETAVLGPHSTDLQRAKIEAWYNIQNVYMSAVALVRQKEDSNADSGGTEAYEMSLFMPSECRANGITVDHKLLSVEWDLRFAQAHEALGEIRRQLLVRTQLWRYKDRNITGQKSSTRSQTVILGVDEKINIAKARYHKARKALAILETPLIKTQWKEVLQVLHDADVTALIDEDAMDKNGARELSWIWRTIGVGSEEESGAHMAESLRIEWCKSRARAQRWREECILTVEEMRRVLAFMVWSKDQWLNRVNGVGPLPRDRAMQEAANAYAYRQAKIQVDIGRHCEVLWASQVTLMASTKVIDKEKKKGGN
ncbi:hypothetical protein C8J56DRAFT_1005073 [Mycena floridula]|nr:hypothetical protein C8J56DRAFT_1005073 [Mycena floridula]